MLKTERSIRLSLWLPIIASATLLALWSILTWHQYDHFAGEQLSGSKDFVAHDLTSLQKVLERNYVSGKFLDADQAIAQRQEMDGIEALVILDNNRQVLHASNRDWVGRAVTDVLPSFTTELSAALLSEELSNFSHEVESQRIFAYFPVFALPGQANSAATKVGSIFLVYQHQLDRGALLQESLLETLPLLLFLSLAMAVFVGLLHVYVTRPSQHLMAAASALATGSQGSQSQVHGKGELAHISHSFNQMSMDLVKQRLEQDSVEQMLRKSEGRLRQAQRIAKLGHYHLDVATNLWTSSAELNDIFGLDKDFARDLDDWVSLIHPEDAQRLANYLQHDVIEKNQPFDLEYRIIDQRDGRVKWVHGFGQLEHDSDGQVTCMFGAIQDITRRKLNEHALFEATEIINRSPTVAFRWKNLPGWPIHFVSENSAPLFGYSKEEFTQGKIEYSDLIHPEDRTRVLGEVASNANDQENTSFTHTPYRILTKDGKSKWVDDRIFICRDQEGEITGYEGLVTDVTERETHRRLAAFQAQRAKVLLAIPLGAENCSELDFLQFCLAQAENLTDSSISFVRFVNDDEQTIELATWSKQTISKFCQIITDSHYPVRSAGIWADSLREHRAVVFNDYENYESKHGLPEGHAPLERLISLPVIDQGKVVMLIGVGNKDSNYTELEVETLQLIANEMWRIVQHRRAEKERDLVLIDTQERVKEARALYQLEKTIEHQQDLAEIFRAAVQIVPEAWLHPESACARLTIEGEEYCSPDFLETKWKQSENIVVSGKTLGVLEVCYREQKPERDEGPFLNEERALLISFALNLSRAVEHARAKEARETAELQLRQVQKMEAVGQLTGGIAHDFNNILCIILGNVDLLEMDMGPNDSKLQRVQTIGKSAQRAADLTKQMLGFSRKQATEVALIDLNDSIQAMNNLIIRTLTPTIEVEEDFAQDLWKSEIDGADFKDALLNLVLNARDAMPSGGSLTIATRNITLTPEGCLNQADATAGDFVQVQVSDTGEGIPYALQEHIFEPFFTTKDQGKGTGLGLAMVYGFVQRSKGMISCNSEPDVGTTFTIRLPRSLVVEQEAKSEVVRSGNLPSGTETILVVDDELDLIEVAKQSLESLGYRVITAINGGQALMLLTAHEEIDLLFSDIVMPGGINGHQLVQRARTVRPELRALLTSGYAQDALADSSNGEPQTVLRKPYNQEELAFQIRSTLDAPPAPAPILPQENGEGPQTLAIEWTPELAIGIEALDADHQVLLQLISHGQKLLNVENESAKTAFILRELKAYSESHFAREEVVMQACGYPEFENHKQVHSMLLRKLDALCLSQKQGGLRASDFSGFLGSWWEDHVRIMDQAITPHCVGKEDRIAEALEDYFLAQLHQDKS
mgnify:CR=1 FL=1